jgi:hypothetical protein
MRHAKRRPVETTMTSCQPRSLFIVFFPRSRAFSLRVSHSTFRVPHSAFRIPRSAFRVKLPTL